MGGARTHVLGLVPELAAIAPTDEVLLLAQPDLLADLPPLPSTWLLRAEQAHTRGFVGRLAWEQRILPRITRRFRADVLLSFGSFVPLRSPCPTVLEAGNTLPHLRRRYRGVRVVLTGSPGESRWSRRSAGLARQLGVGEHVCFAGDVPNAKVAELIREARLLVFPTWCESFGLPLAEALAMGAPAVAADIPACREVGGDAAWYYSPGEVDSLSAAIDDLLRFPEATAGMARMAYERGKQFDWRDNA